MADKRISQLVDRGTVANNDVVPIVVSGATTTNKATISSIQTFMQGNLDLGVTSVGITLGSSGTDVSVSGSPITSSGNITINLPTASATNRGLLSSADWSTFNSKQQAITLTTTGTSGAATLVSGTLNIPNYSTDLSGYVTLGTTQTITAQKTFTTSGSSDTMIISHGSGSGFALDVLKAGNGEAIRVTKTSGSGNAMTISGGNFEAGTIVKTGGTSSQFLKADGSVDSSIYLTTASATAVYVPYTGANSGVNLGQFNLSASSINVDGPGVGLGSYLGFKHSTSVTTGSDGYTSMYTFGTNTIGFKSISGATTKDFSFSMVGITAGVAGGRTYTLPDASGTLALTTDLGAYLPLTGGTLTGALNGTSASFTGALIVSNNAITQDGTRPILTLQQSGTTKVFLGISSGASDLVTGDASGDAVFRKPASSGAFRFSVDGGTSSAFVIASTGAATFSSSVTATSGTFSGTAGNQTPFLTLNATSANATFNWVSQAFASNLSAGNNLVHFIGQSNSNKNSGYLGFKYAGAGSNDNILTLGLFGVDNILNINGSGNVGIGTASPSSKFVTSNGGAVGFEIDPTVSASVARTLIYNRATSAYANIENWALSHQFHVNGGNEAMRITSGGDVQIGIATAATNVQLNINGFLNKAGRIQFQESGVSKWLLGNGAASENGRFEIYDNTNGTGVQLLRGATSWTSLSDERFKDIIEPISVLDKLKNIRAVVGKYKTDEEGIRRNFVIAQDLLDVFPEVVDVDEDEDKPMGVRYTDLIPILIASIQELKTEIDSLKNQIK